MRPSNRLTAIAPRRIRDNPAFRSLCRVATRAVWQRAEYSRVDRAVPIQRMAIRQEAPRPTPNLPFSPSQELHR